MNLVPATTRANVWTGVSDLEATQPALVDRTQYAVRPVTICVDEFTLDGALLVRGGLIVLILDSELPKDTLAAMSFEMDSVRFDISVRIGKTYSQSSTAVYLEVTHAPHDRIEDAVWRRLTQLQPSSSQRLTTRPCEAAPDQGS